MISFKKFLYENWFDVNDNSHLKRRVSIRELLGKPSFTPEERKSVNEYIKDSKPIHEKIKSGKLNDTHIKNLDSYIDKNRIPAFLHTYSSLGFNPQDHINDKNELHIPGYLSTTPHKDVAKDYSKNSSGIHHIAHITLNKGDPASPLHTHEDEVLIGRGQKFKYHGHKDIEEGDKKFRIHRLSII